MGARWEDEELIFRHPDPEKIHCKDCILRKPDVTLESGSVLNGAAYGICLVFPLETGGKPDEVLFKNQPCPYHVGEDEE